MAKDDLILDAALDLFEERGYSSTPVPLLAEHAGVAAGTIYRYFPGKEGVVNALYRRWKSAMADAVLDGLDPDGDPSEVFAGIWQRLCRFALDHPGAFAFLETHHHQPYLDHESRQVADDLDAAMASIVQRWQAAGVARAGAPELLVAQVHGGLVGVVRALRHKGQPLPADLADRTLEPAWDLLTGTPHPRPRRSRSKGTHR